MDDNKKRELLDRVGQVNQKEEKLSFKVDIGDKNVFSVDMPIGAYSKDVLKNGPEFYYFFKDVASAFEEILAKKHKELVWKETVKN